MKRWFPWLGTLVLSLLLAACSSTGEPARTKAPTRTPDTRPSATIAVKRPTTDPNPTRTPTPVPAPTEAVDYCVGCHTDKDRLVSNLKPTQAVVSENEGAG